MTIAHYLVLQVPSWRAHPNGMALVRVYDHAPETIWFGIFADSTGTRRPYPVDATVVANYGQIADTDEDSQREAEISAIRLHYPSQCGISAEEGWIDPAGRSYVCQAGESYEELARRISAVLWDKLSDRSDLEARAWIHLTASTDLSDSTIT